MTEKIIGIVIDKIEYRDNDYIIKILTSDEMISFIAMGARKINSKNGRTLDYGNLIEVEIFRARLSNKLSKLKKSALIKQPPVLESDTAVVLMDIIKFIKKCKTSTYKLFNSFVLSYDYLGKEYNHHVKTFITFNILDELGVYPNTNVCVECGRHDRIIGFDFKDGGFQCIDHAKFKRSYEFLISINKLGKGIMEYKDTEPNLNKRIYLEILEFISTISW